MSLNGVHKKMAGEILALIQKMMECDCNAELEIDRYSEKMLVCVDTFSNSVAGTASNISVLKISLAIFW